MSIKKGIDKIDLYNNLDVFIYQINLLYFNYHLVIGKIKSIKSKKLIGRKYIRIITYITDINSPKISNKKEYKLNCFIEIKTGNICLPKTNTYPLPKIVGNILDKKCTSPAFVRSLFKHISI